MTHIHNADPDAGPVCSQFVTDEMFSAWGWVTKRTDKIVGTPVVTRPGISSREATMKAWNAGKIRVCTRSKPCVTPRRQSSPEARRESMIWAEANLRAEDRHA